MAKKQGKIKAISVVNPKQGQQVYHPNTYGISKVLRPHEEEKTMVYIQSGYCTVAVQITNLRELVVEYDDANKNLSDYYQNGLGGNNKIQIPLKYSQWQKALDNGEVNSDKELRFMEVWDYNNKNSINYAKIIPSRVKNEIADLIAAYDLIESWNKKSFDEVADKFGEFSGQEINYVARYNFLYTGLANIDFLMGNYLHTIGFKNLRDFLKNRS